MVALMDTAFAPLLPGQTIFDRLGKVDGILMQSKVDKLYEDASLRGATVPYFDKSGKPLLSKHPVNDRVQSTVVAAYVKVIQREGVGLRSLVACNALCKSIDFPILVCFTGPDSRLTQLALAQAFLNLL